MPSTPLLPLPHFQNEWESLAFTPHPKHWKQQDLLAVWKYIYVLAWICIIAYGSLPMVWDILLTENLWRMAWACWTFFVETAWMPTRMLWMGLNGARAGGSLLCIWSFSSSFRTLIRHFPSATPVPNGRFTCDHRCWLHSCHSIGFLTQNALCRGDCVQPNPLMRSFFCRHQPWFDRLSCGKNTTW